MERGPGGEVDPASVQASQRVSPLALPEAYKLPPKPRSEADAQSADAYRQSGFVLGKDLRLFERAMNLQLAILRDSYAVRYRTHRFAAIAMPWSRAFASERDAFALALQGAYISATPLLAAAAEAIAAQIDASSQPPGRFEQWLAGVGRPDEELKATVVPLAGVDVDRAIRDDDVLGPVHRAARLLGSVDPGALLLQTAPESNMQKLAMTFAERAFHLGWAELTFGWALALAGRQLSFALGAGDVLNVTEERRRECADLAANVAEALNRRDRCAVVDVGGEAQGIIVTNFRRMPGSAPRRFVLRPL